VGRRVRMSGIEHRVADLRQSVRRRGRRERSAKERGVREEACESRLGMQDTVSVHTQCMY
jgi:hypothetical protein